MEGKGELGIGIAKSTGSSTYVALIGPPVRLSIILIRYKTKKYTCVCESCWPSNDFNERITSRSIRRSIPDVSKARAQVARPS